MNESSARKLADQSEPVHLRLKFATASQLTVMYVNVSAIFQHDAVGKQSLTSSSPNKFAHMAGCQRLHACMAIAVTFKNIAALLVPC